MTTNRDYSLKALVIMNGKAGGGVKLGPLARKILRLSVKKNLDLSEIQRNISDTLKNYNVDADFVFTSYPGHATDLARIAAENGLDAVIAVGGDGTINEVVNGLVHTRTALGIIPIGTANVLSMELNLPSDIVEGCQVIAEGHTRTIDLGCVGKSRYFTIMAGVGFDAHVVRCAEKGLKSTWGVLAYPLVVLRDLLFYPFDLIKVRTQEGRELQARYLLIQNARRYGSGFIASPNSSMDDGMLEVLAFPSRSLFQIFCYLLSSHKDRFKIKTEEVKTLEILTPHEIQVDGDFFCLGPSTVEIVPKALRVFVPRTST